MPPQLDSLDLEYQKRRADNRFSASKFIDFAFVRADILQRLEQFSREALVYINKHIDPEERFAIEKELMLKDDYRQAAPDDAAWNQLKALAKQHFTHIKAEEWAAFRQEIIEELEAAAAEN